MEALHIKIDFSQALNSKKNILSAELSVLNILQKLKLYRELRQKELSKKQNLALLLKSLSNSIASISKALPKSRDAKSEMKEIAGEIKTKSRTEDELREIKRQLERLNSI